jgi:hypothetical protein
MEFLHIKIKPKLTTHSDLMSVINGLYKNGRITNLTLAKNQFLMATNKRITLMMEEVSTSESFVLLYQTARRKIPKGTHLQTKIH